MRPTTCLLALVLVAACQGGGGGGRAQDAGTSDLPTPPPVDMAAGRDGAPPPDAALVDAASSGRDGRIPRPPTGAPPCEPGAMAVHDQRCPYMFLVTCKPQPDTRPSYVCYCFAPPLSGKWVCQDEPDGGVVTNLAAN